MTTGTPPSAPPKRSRARTLVPLAIAAWLLAEIWLLVAVARAAGGLTVLALLVAGAVLGGYVIKRAGRRAFRNLTETLQRQQSGAADPGAEPRSGGEGNTFTMLGGLLLMVPGLLSDVLGLLCLVPPVRKTLGRYAERSLDKRMRASRPGGLGAAFQQARIHQPDGKVVRGEVIREDAGSSPYHEERGPRPPLT
ncbi:MULTISPECIES: FxsA family membrane protein [unclassified Streptomyces]|uniref:FxsA family membrane protein n=1 Tax=unclassified Streptomyces TaxID=2593676 RepID=UPI0033E5D21F